MNNILTYTDAGYLDVSRIFGFNTVFNFIVGGRGIGKTYGFLKYVIEHDIKIMYLRRTQKQIDIINKEEFSPFKAVCADLNKEYEHIQLAKGSVKICVDDKEVAYTGALSTFSALRSFDMSDIDCIIYDEFIPESSERVTISHEYEAFLNMYETVNRNRELQGRPAVRLYALANANRLQNKLFLGLRLISVADKMIKEGSSEYHNPYRSISLYFPSAPVSQRKAKTALYKLDSNSEFNAMALRNDFNLDTADVKRLPIGECNPLVNLGELCVWKHKSKTDTYYVSTRQALGSAPVYDATERSCGQFKDRYSRIMFAAVFGDHFYYDSVLSKSLFSEYLQL